jgi:hypothetical protein
MRADLVGALVACLLLSLGAGWYSTGAGLIVAGACVAALTVLFLVDFGGGDGG